MFYMNNIACQCSRGKFRKYSRARLHNDVLRQSPRTQFHSCLPDQFQVHSDGFLEEKKQTHCKTVHNDLLEQCLKMAIENHVS